MDQGSMEKSSSKPKIAYAANRKIGLVGLEAILAHGWKPSALMVATGKGADHADQMKQLVPDGVILAGDLFRTPFGIRTLQSLDLDYILSIHFPYLITREVLAIPKIGTLNLHPAYLPFNRGWHTPSWAIIEETPYGATFHWVEEGLDTGDIVFQKALEINPDDTAHSLYQRVLKIEEAMIQEAIPLLLAKQIARNPQGHKYTSHTKKDIENIRKLNLNETKKVKDIINQLRGLTTNNFQEAAYFEQDGVRYLVRIEIQREITGEK
jgi:methionyl-tRNA formyltransferase